MPNAFDDIKQEIIKASSYILFLSVDIVNSTKYKDTKPSWGSIFDKFYENFNLLFIDALSKSNILDNVKDIPSPVFWKYLGDEIIYKVTIKNKIYLPYYLDSFRNTINSFRETEFSEIDLDLKATAWTAGFPVKNSIIQTKIPFNNKMLVDKHNQIQDIEVSNNSQYNLEDYIGPSMDIGFRISGFSSKNKFIIGRSLAVLLLESTKTESFKIYFDGKQVIKGVKDSYPIIWINMKRDHLLNEEDELINRNPANIRQLKDYLDDNIKESNKPCIINNPNDITDDYLEKYRKKFKPESIDDTNTNEIFKDINIKIEDN